MKLTMRAGAVGAVVFGLLTLAGSVWPDETTGDDGHPVVTGCTIRFEGPTPRIHANAAHLCTGAYDVGINDDGDLVVYSTIRGPIISVVAEEDETLSALGIQAGASGGTGRTIVRLYDTFGARVRADSPNLATRYANVWLLWVHA
jgi:hypothetical protein